jgi:hypothetical protein
MATKKPGKGGAKKGGGKNAKAVRAKKLKAAGAKLRKLSAAQQYEYFSSQGIGMARRIRERAKREKGYAGSKEHIRDAKVVARIRAARTEAKRRMSEEKALKSMYKGKKIPRRIQDMKKGDPRLTRQGTRTRKGVKVATTSGGGKPAKRRGARAMMAANVGLGAAK